MDAELPIGDFQISPFISHTSIDGRRFIRISIVFKKKLHRVISHIPCRFVQGCAPYRVVLVDLCLTFKQKSGGPQARFMESMLERCVIECPFIPNVHLSAHGVAAALDWRSNKGFFVP